jgi:hypothetical protein
MQNENVSSGKEHKFKMLLRWPPDLWIYILKSHFTASLHLEQCNYYNYNYFLATPLTSTFSS